MANLVGLVISFFASKQLLLVLSIVSLLVNMYVLSLLITGAHRSEKVTKQILFMMAVIVGATMADLAWTIDSLEKLFFPFADPRVRLFFIRFAWIGFIAEYHFLGLFIESLIEKKYIMRVWHKVLLATSSLICGYLLYIAFFRINHAQYRSAIEFKVYLGIFFYIYILVIPSLYTTVKKLRSKKYPKILRAQSMVFIYSIITPLLVAEFLQADPFAYSSIHKFTEIGIVLVNLTFIIRTYAIYYSTKKVMGIRFLNMQSHVSVPKRDKSRFIDYFRDILEQLGNITTQKELQHTTQIFFKDVINIPFSRTRLYIRTIESTPELTSENKYIESTVETRVEQFISTDRTLISTNPKAPTIIETLGNLKILIRDEIEFNNFHKNNDTNNLLMDFLDSINAEIFLPIFRKDELIGYTIIEIDNQSNKLYNDVERDKMVVFSSYLGNVINLLQNKNLYSLIQKDKELKEELYNKHQEINQYKESIRSFLRNSIGNNIGVMFYSYKNRKIAFGNKIAEQIIEINPNTQEGHYLTRDIRNVIHQVVEYKSPQNLHTIDINGNKIVLCGIPSPENNFILVFVYYPEISAILKDQINKLKDPTNWDYLLYLETTKSGKVINQLIPGTGESLLDFKINLLKIALNKKAILLDIPEEDLTSTVEIIHHISLRENLHILSLTPQTKNSNDITIKLFGINAIFGTTETQPLLEKLNKNGTLFIKNIHFMNIEAQEQLAEFIQYGFYRIYKSDIKVWSDVRIICSSNQNLKSLVMEGEFSETLYKEINKASLEMPSLLSLPEDELKALVDGYSQQAIKSKDLKNFLKLTEAEKNRLVSKHPVSFHEFKEQIHSILVNKSKRCSIYDEAEFDPAYLISDPDLIEISRLGKNALKDKKMMLFLWNKFKNQSKIASFLGVNRSSVNRRCKEFDLEE